MHNSLYSAFCSVFHFFFIIMIVVVVAVIVATCERVRVAVNFFFIFLFLPIQQPIVRFIFVWICVSILFYHTTGSSCSFFRLPIFYFRDSIAYSILLLCSVPSKIWICIKGMFFCFFFYFVFVNFNFLFSFFLSSLFVFDAYTVNVNAANSTWYCTYNVFSMWFTYCYIYFSLYIFAPKKIKMTEKTENNWNNQCVCIFQKI